MLESHYRQYQFLTKEIAAFEDRIASAMEPYARQVELLISIPGIDRMVAWHLLAELGIDLKAFPDAAHCSSWAGMVPGENESAGKQKSNRCRKGNKTLRRVLTQAAWAASHCKRGYLRAFFHRVKVRRGWAKAIVATGHKILVIAFQVLKTNTPYRELGDGGNLAQALPIGLLRFGAGVAWRCHCTQHTSDADQGEGSAAPA